MRFAVALGLGDFVEALPFRAGERVVLVELAAGDRLDDREHAAVGEIAVVRDGQQAAAGLLLVGGHPFPEIARIVAAERREGGVGLDLAGLRAVVAEDHVAVQVVAAGIRGPLVADEGREAPWLIGLFRGLDGRLPRRAVAGAARQVLHRRRHLSGTVERQQLVEGLPGLALADEFKPAARGRVGQHLGLPAEEVRRQAHEVRVIRHHEKVERTREAHPLATGGGHLLALGEAIRLHRAEAGSRTCRRQRTSRCAGACRRRAGASESCAPRRASTAAWTDTPCRPFLVERAAVSDGVLLSQRWQGEARAEKRGCEVALAEYRYHDLPLLLEGWPVKAAC